MTAAKLVGNCSLRPHLLLNLPDVIEVVGQGSVDVGKGDGRNVRDDLIGSHTLVLMPDNDIADTDTVTGDAGFAATNARGRADPFYG